jgi:DNA-binding response OmpR family regulator/KaiC/GvpD/RAD55 family RecA-like ATPase
VTGVQPIDDALGGLERGRAHVLYGDAETGKSSMAMRFLVEGLRRGESCALVVRYDGSSAVAAMATFGYDCADDLRGGRLVILEFADDIVDRLAHVDDLQPILDELGRFWNDTRPMRIVFDTADFVFSIRFGYGYPLQISALTAWLSQTGAASLLLVDERMADRVVQSFRANAATVMHALTRRTDDGLEYHLAFEKSAVKAPSRRVGLAVGEFSTLEVYDARARTLPLPGSPRRRQAGDRTGQLTIPEDAARIVNEAVSSADLPLPTLSVPPIAKTPQRAGRPRVLVVDEERVACQLVGRALAPEFDIAVEPDGIAGLARLATFDPDLVLLETQLPLVDGFTICRQIREASSVPIVMVSRTHTSPEDRVRSAEAGADHLLVKPFGLRELAVRARQLVARFRGRPIPSGSALGELPADPLVTYDQFVERLVLNASGPPRALVGFRVEPTTAFETGLVVDLVRADLRPEDVMTYEPEERQLVASVPPELAEEVARRLERKIRELTAVEASFWVAAVPKGTAVRVLEEQFERDRRRARDEGLEVTG